MEATTTMDFTFFYTQVLETLTTKEQHSYLYIFGFHTLLYTCDGDIDYKRTVFIFICVFGFHTSYTQVLETLTTKEQHSYLYVSFDFTLFIHKCWRH